MWNSVLDVDNSIGLSSMAPCGERAAEILPEEGASRDNPIRVRLYWAWHSHRHLMAEREELLSQTIDDELTSPR